MIQIQYKGLDEKIKTAVKSVNALFQFSGFYDAIRRHRRFDMANVPPSWIADLLESSNLYMRIDFYYSVNPFSNALVYDDPKDLTVIHFNKWNLDKQTGSICNAIIHQCVHAVNALYSQYSFGHGSNEEEGKENTAPFWIANLAQQIIMQDDSARATLFHEQQVNIPAAIYEMPVRKTSFYTI
jgi:hypothetical protein